MYPTIIVQVYLAVHINWFVNLVYWNICVTPRIVLLVDDLYKLLWVRGEDIKQEMNTAVQNNRVSAMSPGIEPRVFVWMPEYRYN